jgi:hypothetical protein
MSEMRQEPDPKGQPQDPQDKEMGASAKRDQERVDDLDAEGVTEDELSDEPGRDVRTGGKATPA